MKIIRGLDAKPSTWVSWLTYSILHGIVKSSKIRISYNQKLATIKARYTITLMLFVLRNLRQFTYIFSQRVNKLFDFIFASLATDEVSRLLFFLIFLKEKKPYMSTSSLLIFTFSQRKCQNIKAQTWLFKKI